LFREFHFSNSDGLVMWACTRVFCFQGRENATETDNRANAAAGGGARLRARCACG
jgi:hypothetical protein